MYRKRLFNFILPNISILIRKRVYYKKYPVCNQKTLLTGTGKITIGKNCVFGYKPGGFFRGGSVELQSRFSRSEIEIGDSTATNNNVFICAANRVEIGAETLIGQNVCIMDFDAHGIDPNKRKKIGEIGVVVIGRNVWIGNNVIILKNSFIGDNSVVAAGAVVTGEFPPNTIIGGVPAKVIKNL